MRKDYISDPSQGAASEAAFIEQHWTSKWREQDFSAAPPYRVPLRAEYRIMAPYLGRLPATAKLLDGGCGLGEWTACLAGKGYRVLGLDISGETIARLQAAYPEGAFAQGDIRDTGLPDDEFDGYLSWGTFEHFEDGLQGCITEARRILKPGGLLFVTVPFDNLRLRWGRARHNAAPEPPAQSPRRFYQWRLTRDELRDELTRGGFEVIETRPLHKRQGIVRVLNARLGLPWRWLLTRALGLALAPFVPSAVIAHMLMAVVRKPED